MKKRLFAALFAVYILFSIGAGVFAAGISAADDNTAVVTVAENERDSGDAAVVEEKPKAETSSGIPKVDKSLLAKHEEESEVSFVAKFVNTFKKNFYNTFVREDRWKLFAEGFGNTVLIALCSTLLGVLIGMAVALIKVFKAQIDRPNIIVSALNVICNLYTTLIRGTPAVVQLFIAYYIIFKTSDNYVVVSIFAFGINSGAYVSEIIRAGIVSIDRGQLEAGRSLGLSHVKTMIYIVLPQAVKNILPSLGNEFILLLKDTSIAGYIGTTELMKAGNIVRSRTFEPYFSLLSVAAVYLVCVIGMEQILRYFERRLAKSDRH